MSVRVWGKRRKPQTRTFFPYPVGGFWVPSERLQVVLELLTGQYKAEARAAAAATRGVATATKETTAQTGALSTKLGDVTLKQVAASRAFQKAKDIIGDAVRAARDLNESYNAVNKTFGEGAEIVSEFGEIAAQTAGLSKREFQDLATVTGALLTNLGQGQKEAAQESIRLTQRAADLASVFNTDVSTAVEAINSSLQGQQKPLRQFGINLSDAEIRAKAVALGLADTTAEVDKNAKAQATLALIYEQSDQVAGDFLQTSDELANSQRRAAAAAENASARFGQSLLPLMTDLQNFGADVLSGVSLLGVFGSDAADAAQEALKMQEAIENINLAVEDGRDPFTALADSLLHIAANGNLTQGTFEALAAQTGLNVDQYERFSELILEQGEALGLERDILEELEAAMQSTGDTTVETVPQYEAHREAVEEARKAAQEAKDAQRDLRLEYLAAADPVFAASAAIARYQEAQENLANVQEDGESTAQDIARASLEVANAALEAEAAMVDFAQNPEAGIQTLADALNITHEEAIDLLEQLDIIDGMSVNTFVTTTFIEKTSSNPQTLGAGQTNIFGAQHGGGPVNPGNLIRVGEQNLPELYLIPGDQGRMFSFSDTQKLINSLSGMQGGGDRTTHINLNGDLHGGEEIMEAVQKSAGLVAMVDLAEVNPR